MSLKWFIFVHGFSYEGISTYQIGGARGTVFEETRMGDGSKTLYFVLTKSTLYTKVGIGIKLHPSGNLNT